MDWSTRSCARNGHLTFAPTDDRYAAQLSVETPVGQAWKCLRCGAFIPGPAFSHGPVEHAPSVLHDRQIRDRVIIRFLAVERGIRGFIVLLIGFALFQLKNSQETLESTLSTSLPLLKPFADQIGWDINNSRVIHLLDMFLEVAPHTLWIIAVALIAYGILQLTECFGLWFQKRWAEYLTVVATSAFIPIEIYELTHSVTFIKAGALVVNIAAVLWLLWSKHLFGINGGASAAHDDALVGKSALDYAVALRTTVPAP